VKQAIGSAIAIAGLAAIALCLYLIHPALLIGVGGVIAVGVGNLISRSSE